MYVAVKGGERAIASAHRWLADQRRGDREVLELSVPQIREQLGFAVDRVMNEGSCYDPELAALVIKQAAGDLVEAALLLRAYRTMLPRLGYTEPVATENMRVRRRISAIYKDLPGDQVLGPTLLQYWTPRCWPKTSPRRLPLSRRPSRRRYRRSRTP